MRGATARRRSRRAARQAARLGPAETRRLDAAFWHARWREGQIGFHQHEVNPYLRRYWPALAAPPGSRVLVPLCGKSHDLAWLAAQGHEVLGVELVPLAVEAYFAERGQVPVTGRSGSFVTCAHGPVTILCGDFFDLAAEHMGGVRSVYDRASLVALPPSLRGGYARHLLGLACGGGAEVRPRILLVSFDYPQEQMDGPPFSVPEAEVRERFASATRIDRLCTEDVLAANPRFRQKGLTRLEESVFLIVP